MRKNLFETQQSTTNYGIIIYKLFQNYIYYHLNDLVYTVIFFYSSLLQNIINKNMITQQIQNEDGLFRRVPSKSYPTQNAPLG